MSGPTPPLAEFLPRYRADDNEWWRLGSGDHQNLFEDAIDECDTLRAAASSAADAALRFARALITCYEESRLDGIADEMEMWQIRARNLVWADVEAARAYVKDHR